MGGVGVFDVEEEELDRLQEGIEKILPELAAASSIILVAKRRRASSRDRMKVLSRAMPSEIRKCTNSKPVLRVWSRT